MNASLNERARLLIQTVRYQCPKSREANFMFSVWERAIMDAYMDPLTPKTAPDVRSALTYLADDQSHLFVIGVSPDWVRHQMKTLGLTTKYGRLLQYHFVKSLSSWSAKMLNL